MNISSVKNILSRRFLLFLFIFFFAYCQLKRVMYHTICRHKLELNTRICLHVPTCKFAYTEVYTWYTYSGGERSAYTIHIYLYIYYYYIKCV